MKVFWTGMGLAFAGLVVILMFPVVETRGDAAQVYSTQGPIWPWIGWVLMAAGLLVIAISAWRSRLGRRRR